MLEHVEPAAAARATRPRAAIAWTLAIAVCCAWAFWLSSESLRYGKHSYYREHDTAEANGAFYAGQAAFARRGLLGFWTPSAGSGVDALSNGKGMQPLFEGLFRVAPYWWTPGVVGCFEALIAALFTVVLLRRRLSVPFVPALLAGCSFALGFAPPGAFSGFFLPAGLLVPALPLIIFALTWAGERQRPAAILCGALVGALIALTSGAVLVPPALLFAAFWIAAVEPRPTARHALVLLACGGAFVILAAPTFAAMSLNAAASHRTLWPSSFSLPMEAARWAARRQEVLVQLGANAPFLAAGLVGWLFGGWSRRALTVLIAVNAAIFLEILFMVAIRNVMQSIYPPFATFQIDRVSQFLPLLAAAAGALGLQQFLTFFGGIRARVIRYGGFALAAAACAALGAMLWQQASTVNRERESLRVQYSNYASFFEQPELRELAREMRDQPLARVATFADGNSVPGGQHAAFAWAYGLETADGYLNMYSLRYHAFWRQVIGPALELRDDLQEYFEDWGNMIYLFNPFEPGPRPRPAAHAFNLNLLSLANVRYLISSVALDDPRLVEWSGNRGRPPVDATRAAGSAGAQVNRVFVYENRDWLPRFFVARAVRTFDTRDALLAGLAAADIGTLRTTAFLERGDGAPRTMGGDDAASAPAGNAAVRVASYGADRIELDVDTPVAGLLVATNSYAPYWRATVDGRAIPVLPVDGTFQGTEVPAGRSRVVLRYAPPYAFPIWERGLVVAGFVGALFIGFGRRWRVATPFTHAPRRPARAAAALAVAVAVVGAAGVAWRVAAQPHAPPVAWGLPDWPYRQLLQVRAVQGMLAPVDLPLLVQRSAGDVAFWNHVSSADDVAFTDADGGRIPYEIQRFDPQARVMIAWVGVPRAGNMARTVVMYYGHRGPLGDPTRLWKDYVGVWHFDDAPDAMRFADSSAHSHDIAANVRMKDHRTTAGRIGGAVSFAGGADALTLPTSEDWSFGAEDWSIELWINPAPQKKRDYGIVEHGVKGLFQFYLHNEGFLVLERTSRGETNDLSFANARPDAQTWTHVVLDRHRDAVKVTMDGNLVDSQIALPNSLDSVAAVEMTIGRGGHGGFEGDFDELRISKGVVHPPQWSRAVYLAQTGGLVESGPEEAHPR